MPKRFLNLKLKLQPEDRPILALFVHVSLVVIIYTLLYLLGVNTEFPNANNLINWDAIWYNKIKQVGYYYIEGQQCPLAFFPLFPFFWKFSSLDPQGISLFNLLVFSIGFYFVAKQLALDFLNSMFFLSTPCLIFCALPYTESFFFLASVSILIGLEKNNERYIVTGILIASLIRAVNITFIPAIIFTYVSIFGYNKLIVKPILIQIAIIILAICTTLYIQYYFTGQWFAFFKVQKTWRRSLQLPTLPLTTLTGSKMLWMDGIALSICIFALIDTVKTAINTFIYRVKSNWSAATLFSMAYLSIIGVLAIFFSGVWPNQLGTSIMSIDRYVFATPYFIFYIYHKIKKLKGKRVWIESIMILAVTVLILGGYRTLPGLSGYGSTLFYFGAMVVYTITYLYFQSNKKVQILLYVINIAVQIIFINRFLSFRWIG